MLKLLAESTNPGNVKVFSTIEDEYVASIDIIEAMLEKAVDVFVNSSKHICGM